MQQSISRGEKILQSWVNPQTGLTEAGKDFLLAALDPFHDTQLKNLQGWPDVETSSSVVRCVKQSVDFSATSGGHAPVNAPWDAHVALFPWLDARRFSASSVRSNNVFKWNSAADQTASLGGVAVKAVFNTGSDVNWYPGEAGDTTTLANVVLPDAYQQGMGRLIGVGFELVDTSADINKQGSLICYRANEMPRDPCTFVQIDTSAPAGDISFGVFAGSIYRDPPTNVAQALLMPGSRKWNAREGAYVVGAFHSNENPPFTVNYNVPVMMSIDQDDDIGSDVSNTTVVHVPISFNNLIQVPTVGPSFVFETQQPFKLHPVHTAGVILSGLNPNSTFSLSVNYYYESFPSITEEDILVLATPSAEFDPTALALYSRTLSLLPVGVMFKENAEGDWFFEMLSKASNFIGPMLSALPHPLAKAAGTAISMAGTHLQPKKKKKKARQSPALGWEDAPGGYASLMETPQGPSMQKRQVTQNRRRQNPQNGPSALKRKQKR